MSALPDNERQRLARIAVLADRGRQAMIHIATLTASDPSGKPFALQEPFARDYAATGEWAGRAALAVTLIGLAGECEDRMRAASAAAEAAFILSGCVVDAQSPADSGWAGNMSQAASAVADAKLSGRAQPFLFVLPFGIIEGAST